MRAAFTVHSLRLTGSLSGAVRRGRLERHRDQVGLAGDDPALVRAEHATADAAQGRDERGGGHSVLQGDTDDPAQCFAVAIRLVATLAAEDEHFPRIAVAVGVDSDEETTAHAAVMEAGHIRQIGSPEDIYARPKSHFVADFIGKANFLWGEVLSADLVTIGSHEVAVQPHDHPSGQRMQVMIRPEALSIDRTEGQFKGTVERAMFLGSILECVVNVEDVGRVMIDIPNPVAFGRLEVGQEVYVTPIPGLPAVEHLLLNLNMAFQQEIHSPVQTLNLD